MLGKLIKVGRWLVIALLVMAVLFVAINSQFFIKQVNFWWGQDVSHKAIPINPTATDVPDQIQIPALQVQAPLVYIDSTDVLTVQSALAQGVVHYPGTVLPGEFGNAFYFGHSSDFISKPGRYKTVFALLPRIEIGQEILVNDGRGRQFTYRVVSKQVVPATATEWLDQGDRRRRLLTLQTSYPVGTAIARYIVQAEIKQ